VPKPKHMDSQIDFVAIRGTSDQETQDSQLITEHQKEIREEQAQVAAWFAQLASKKPRRRSKTDMETTGSKKPSNDVINTPIGSQRGTQHDMVPETAAKKNGWQGAWCHGLLYFRIGCRFAGEIPRSFHCTVDR